MIWNLIPVQYRIYVVIAMSIGLFASGWYCKSVWDGYNTNKKTEKTVENLGKGQNAIIDFNQKFDKGLQDAKKTTKHDCISEPIPDSIRVLLGPGK